MVFTKLAICTLKLQLENNMQTYYLNNTGSRWVLRDSQNRNDQIKLQTKSGETIIRRVKFYEMFGNFATACISYKGKLIQVFADTVLED